MFDLASDIPLVEIASLITLTLGNETRSHPMTDPIVLRFLVGSALKAAPVQSRDLSASSGEVFHVDAGDTFELREEPFKIEGVPGIETDDHYFVRLKNPLGDTRPNRRWCAYAPHVEIEGTEEGNSPADSAAEIRDLGMLAAVPIIKEIPVIKWGDLIDHDIPDLSNKVRMRQPIFKGAHFTWGEATHGGTRIPASANVTKGIIRIAHAMEEIRSKLGDRPIRVNSWYRDPITNRRVGGASRSRHLSGDAVDFVVKGMKPSDVYRILDPWWGSRGGLASSSVFTHVDGRGGVRARWSYGY